MNRGITLLLTAWVVLACGAPTSPSASRLASATSTEAPSVDATPAPTAAPTAEATAAATPEATPEATVEATAETTPEATPAGSANAFTEALAFLTPETALMSFDDWAQIKESLGASSVTSESPQDERQRVLVEGLVAGDDRPVSDLEYVVGGYGLQSALVHADNWGFDVLDYDWDAVLTHDGPPIFTVNLRDDLDMSRVIAHFDERDYATEEVNGVTLRSHELDFSADWLSGELAILNVGILEDGHTLILSSSDDALRDYLSTTPPTPTQSVLAAAAALERPSAAHLVIGSEQICDFVDPILVGADQDLGDVLEEAGPLSPWDVLALGYSKNLDPIGRIAISYADALVAEGDLKGRRLLAEEGPSIIRPEPIAEVQFTVEEASADEGVIEFDVTPHAGYARNLLQPVVQRDLAYATCGG